MNNAFWLAGVENINRVALVQTNQSEIKCIPMILYLEVWKDVKQISQVGRDF